MGPFFEKLNWCVRGVHLMGPDGFLEMLPPLAAPDDDGLLAHAAAEARCVDCLQQVFARSKNKAKIANARDPDGNTPLHRATNNNDIDCARLLLKCGGDPNVANKEGERPIDLAAGKPCSKHIMAELLRHGAEIDSERTKARISPLVLAAAGANAENVTFLLESGADVNSPAASPFHFPAGWTALHAAVGRMDPRTVEAVLRAQGVEVDARDGGGRSPLRVATDLVCRGGRRRRRKDQQQLEALDFSGSRGRKVKEMLLVVRLLLSAGADPGLKSDDDRVSPFGECVLSDRFGLAELLLAAAPRETRDLQSDELLLLAASGGRPDCIRFLLYRAGADVSARADAGAGATGATALHFAVAANAPAAVEVLLEKGADPNARCVRGLTPLALAAACGRTKREVFGLLLEFGAEADRLVVDLARTQQPGAVAEVLGSLVAAGAGGREQKSS